MAEKLVEACKNEYQWALDFKSIIVPDEFEKLIEYASELSKTAIEDIEKFIEDYNERIYEVAYGVTDNVNGQTISFKLELRSPDTTKVNAEIARLSEGGL